MAEQYFVMRRKVPPTVITTKKDSNKYLTTIKMLRKLVETSRIEMIETEKQPYGVVELAHKLKIPTEELLNIFRFHTKTKHLEYYITGEIVKRIIGLFFETKFINEKECYK